MQKQKSKKHKLVDLGPLNVSKTQYRPYVGGGHSRSKGSIIFMGPLENIMFEIPPIESAQQKQEQTDLEKLRLKIAKFFEEKSPKIKEQWALYIRKADIVTTANSEWEQVETYLLKIISQLLQQCRNLSELNQQSQLVRQSLAENEPYQKSADQTRLLSQLSKTNLLTKIATPDNNYSTLAKNSLLKSKLIGKSEYRDTSIYTSANEEVRDTSAHNAQNHNSLLLKISKLEKEIVLYQHRIKAMEEDNRKKIGEMQKQVQLQIGLKYSETMQEKMKYENEVESKKFYNDILAQEFKMLKKKHQELEGKYESSLAELDVLKGKEDKMHELSRYRELWRMQAEDTLQCRLEIRNLREQNQNEIKKNKGLKEKLKEISKNFNYNYNVSLDNQKDRQDLSKILKDFRDWLKFFAVPRVSKGMMGNNTFFPEMMVDTSKQTYEALLPKDDTTDYKLLRPNFFIYFQAYESVIVAQRKFPQRKIMPPSYYLLMRAIFDSMYLHLNFTGDFKQWLTFPQFAASFIQKFDIHPQQRKVILRQSACTSEQKINFILNVFNTGAANSWECETFRSFLLQEYTLDEVFFYLDCRDNLLRGAQVNHNLGSADPMVFVQVGIAEAVIKDKLKNYDRQMLERIKKFIATKKKYKNSKEMIDINFVLKLLLEVYSIEKIKSERFFHHNFKPKTPSAKICFAEYSAFMSKNFPFLTKGDIAKLYKQMYTLGISHVTYKTIHYVCSMRGLFIPLLRTKMAHTNQIWGGEPSEPKQTKMSKVFQEVLFSDLQNSLNNMVFSTEEFGLEEVVESSMSLNRFLHEIDIMRAHRSIFDNRLLCEVEKIVKMKAILGWKNQKYLSYQSLTRDEAKQKLAQVLLLVRQSDQDVLSMRKRRDLREKSMIKLTKNFKIRIQQSLSEFKVVNRKEYEEKLASIDKQSIYKQERDDEKLKDSRRRGEK